MNAGLKTMPRVSKAANLTRVAVIEAAAAVLERDGHSGLTLRAVASELRVQAPALYWYFDDKQTLELALFDHLMTGLVFAPKDEDWQIDLREMARALRAHMTSRRDLGKLPPNGFFFTPQAADLMETAVGLLLTAGLDPRDAFHAFVTLTDYVMNWSRAEGEMRSRSDQRPGLDALARIALTNGTYPNIARAAEAFGRPSDIDEHFNFGLNTIVGGIASMVP